MPRRNRLKTDDNIVNFPPLDQNIRISELVALADNVPISHVGIVLADQMRTMLKTPVGRLVAGENLRQWVIIATLINRLLFEICHIPKDPDFML